MSVDRVLAQNLDPAHLRGVDLAAFAGISGEAPAKPAPTTSAGIAAAVAAIQAQINDAITKNPNAAVALQKQLSQLDGYVHKNDVTNILSMQFNLTSIIQDAVSASRAQGNMNIAEQQQAQMNAIMNDWRDTNQKIHEDLAGLDPYLSDDQKKERQLLEGRLNDPNLTPAQRAQALRDLADYDKKTAKDLDTRIPATDTHGRKLIKDLNHQVDREEGETSRALSATANAGNPNAMFTDIAPQTPAKPAPADNAPHGDTHLAPAHPTAVAAATPDKHDIHGAKPADPHHPVDKTKPETKTAAAPAPAFTISTSGFEVARVETHNGPGTTPGQPTGSKGAVQRA